MSRLILLPAE